MPVFEYKGIDAKGKEVSGIIDADNPRSARSRLRKQGTFPTEVRAQRSGAAKAKGGKRGGKGMSIEVDLSRTFEFVTASDVATMTSQLSTLVGASIPMVEALSALLEQVEKPALKVVLADVKEKVNEGSSLAKALQAHPKVFDDLYVNMVAAGEQSGALDLVLERLTQHTEAMLALRSKVVTALIYPLLMAGVGVSLLTLIFVVVIPKMRKLFDSFGEGLPLLTRMLLGASDLFNDWWWLLLGLTLAGTFLFRHWVKTEKGRKRWDSLLFCAMLIGLPVCARSCAPSPSAASAAPCRPCWPRACPSSRRCRSCSAWWATWCWPRPSSRPPTTSARASPWPCRCGRAASFHPWSAI